MKMKTAKKVELAGNCVLMNIFEIVQKKKLRLLSLWIKKLFILLT